MCPRSSDPFYVVTYYIKLATASWTYSSLVLYEVNFLLGSRNEDDSNDNIREIRIWICIGNTVAANIHWFLNLWLIYRQINSKHSSPPLLSFEFINPNKGWRQIFAPLRSYFQISRPASISRSLFLSYMNGLIAISLYFFNRKLLKGLCRKNWDKLDYLLIDMIRENVYIFSLDMIDITTARRIQ